jgi:multiple sugar transport system permease protein
MKKEMIMNRLRRLAFTVILLMLSLFMIMPFLFMVSTSLKTPAEINSAAFHLIPRRLVFENYFNALSTGLWGRWIFNSIFITTAVTALSLLFNSLAGFAYARLDFPWKTPLFLTMMVGLMIPAQITMIPVFIIMKHFPLAGGNDLFGAGGSGWIDTYPGLMINHLAGAFGVFLCRQYYLNFPKALDDAAEIDGCSPWRTYFQVYLPLSKPLWASLGVLKMTTTWNDYIWPLIITNSEEMRTVQLALTIFRNEVIQWELLMAATTVVTLPLIVAFLFAQKYFVSGLMAGGVKE